MKPLHILSVTPSFNLAGGIENYAMNYLRYMSDTVHMDFITHDCKDAELRKEAEERGGYVFVVPPFSGRSLPNTLGILRKFFKKRGGRYDVIHCNMANAACFYFPYAAKAGIGVRILHSHQDRAADTTAHALRNMPLIAAGVPMATHRIACSRQAGDFLFGDRDYVVIRNAIEVQKFKFDINKRRNFRERYHLGDSVVLGNIGRLTEQKNQKKLLQVLSVLVNVMHLDYRLVIVGEGHLLDSLIREAAALSVEDRVVFAGVMPDVTEALCGMDIFVLPSIYEGLGIVNIEAQASGLPTVVSAGVPDDADMGTLFSKVSLNASDEIWAEHIRKTRPQTDEERADHRLLDRICRRGYDIATEAQRLEDYYRDALNGYA